VELLASLPLARAIREHTDAGTPIVLSDAGSPAGQAYVAAAQALIQTLNGQESVQDFPTISISDD
jgi:ATP-binding protein involved in chromosome partitioning